MKIEYSSIYKSVSHRDLFEYVFAATVNFILLMAKTYVRSLNFFLVNLLICTVGDIEVSTINQTMERVINRSQ